MKKFTFHNVTLSAEVMNGKDEITMTGCSIIIEAETGTEAYSKLCNQLASIHLEWNTDTYSEGDDSEPKKTDELFPDDI